MIHLKGSTLDYKIIEQHEINSIWNDVKDIIAKTNDEILNEQDIYEWLKTGHYTLWIATERDSDKIVGAMTLEYASYPRHKMCRIVTIAGEKMSDWIDDLYMLEKWAEAQGCHYIGIYDLIKVIISTAGTFAAGTASGVKYTSYIGDTTGLKMQTSVSAEIINGTYQNIGRGLSAKFSAGVYSANDEWEVEAVPYHEYVETQTPIKNAQAERAAVL